MYIANLCSCFANVVLQCLSFTRPLIAYLLEKGHHGECNVVNWAIWFLLDLDYSSHSHLLDVAFQAVVMIGAFYVNLKCMLKKQGKVRKHFLQWIFSLVCLISVVHWVMEDKRMLTSSWGFFVLAAMLFDFMVNCALNVYLFIFSFIRHWVFFPFSFNIMNAL